VKVDGLSDKSTLAKEMKDVTDALAAAQENKNEALNDPELESLNKQLTEQEAIVAEADKDLRNIKAAVVQAHPGVPSALLNSIVADKSYALNDTRATAAIMFNKVQGQLQYKTDLIQTNYENDIAVAQMEQTDFQNKMQSMQFYYQYTPEGIADMSAAQYAAANPDMDSGTPAQQRQAL